MADPENHDYLLIVRFTKVPKKTFDRAKLLRDKGWDRVEGLTSVYKKTILTTRDLEEEVENLKPMAVPTDVVFTWMIVKALYASDEIAEVTKDLFANLTEFDSSEDN